MSSFDVWSQGMRSKTSTAKQEHDSRDVHHNFIILMFGFEGLYKENVLKGKRKTVVFLFCQD